MFQNFHIYQIDVKSAFLNCLIIEKYYVEQPPIFKNFKYSNNVFKLKKVLYGLKQAPRAWYGHLNQYFISKDFSIGKVESTIFNKCKGDDMIVIQI